MLLADVRGFSRLTDELPEERIVELGALGQKIEAVEGIVPVRRSLVGRCAAIGICSSASRTAPFLFLAVANYTRKNRRSLR
jgi:hypothetical protein